MASRGAVLRGAQSIPGGARPTPAPQGSGNTSYNGGRGLNAPSIGQVSPLAAQLANEGGYARSYGPFLPRPTDAFTAGAFGPFSPILPVPVDSPPPGLDRPEARRWQFPVGWNLPTGQPGDEGLKLASFEQLRRLADVYSVARAAIEFRKNQVRGIEWDIIPTPDAAKAYQNQPAKMAEFGKRQAKAKKFFAQPDKDYLSYSTWIGAVLEDVFVYDALSLLIRPTRMRGKGVLGGNMDSLMTVTGSTIRPLVDLHGGTPRPPAPAFQQYLFGVPRSDYMTMITGDDLDQIGLSGTQVAQFRGDQMIYAPMVPRDWTPYGFGPIERALIPIRTGIAKQAYQYDWFEESTVPAAYIIPGDTAMTPNQLRELQDALNAIAGDPAWKQKLIVLPPGSHVEPQRPTVAADQLDELVMTQVCMSFAVSPMELGISPRASSTTSPGAANQMAKAAQNSSQDSGLTPILKFLQDIFNSILVNVCNQTDMMFMYEGLQQEEDMDALTGVLVQQFQNGMRTLDECRQELNLQPYGLEESSEPLIVTPTGPTPLSTAVANAQNAAAQSAAQAQQTQAQAGQITAQTAHTQIQAANTQAQTESTQSRTQMAQESHEVSMNTPPEPSAAAGAEGKAEAASNASKPTPGHSAAVAANNAAASRKKSEAADDIVAKVIITDPLAEKRAVAELEALTRHLVKGRHVSTWEPRYLTHGMLADIAKSMAEGLTPPEAASRVLVKNVALPVSEYAWQDGADDAGEAGGAPFQGVEAAELVKIGPKGYIHGWICVRPPCGAAGDKITHADHGKGTITHVDEKGVHARFEDGHEAVLGREGKGDGKPLDYSSLLSKDYDYHNLSTGGDGDHALEDLAHLAGFDKKPNVISEDELEKRIAGDEREMWRGVHGSGNDARVQSRGYVDRFLHGDYYGGIGHRGNGTYASFFNSDEEVAKAEKEFAATMEGAPRDKDGNYTTPWVARMHDEAINAAKTRGEDMAASYAHAGGAVLRMSLSSDAKTISLPDLLSRWHKDLSAIDDSTPRGQAEKKLMTDYGRYAIAHGYDAVTLDNNEVLVLNRGKVSVSDNVRDGK